MITEKEHLKAKKIVQEYENLNDVINSQKPIEQILSESINMDIKIGFRFSKQHESLGKKYWRNYEVVGSSYGLNGCSFPEWKTKEDVLKLTQYVQIIDLPYPNNNGLKGMWDDMKNSQLSINWKPLKQLQKEIEDDMKLLPEFRKFIVGFIINIF